MNFKLLTLSATIATSLALAACGGNSNDKKTEAPANAKNDNVIKIATASPLSGGQSAAGKDNESGAILAVEEINAKGGVEIGGKKYTVELISEDDAGDPKQGATVAQKIVDNATISGVVGHYNSGVTLVAQPVYGAAGLVALTVSTNPDITIKSVKAADGSPLIYRLGSHDGKQGPALATFANKKGFKKIAVLDDATAYGKGLSDQVAKTSKDLGTNVVARESATDKTTDFKSILTKLKALNPDAIFWGGYDDTAATLVKQARELGITAVFLMPDAACTDNYIKLSSGASAGSICSATGLPLSEMPNGAAFKANFEKRFPNQPVQAYAPMYYDGVYTLVEAIKKAGSPDKAKVAAAMKDVSYNGLTGNISFDSTGELKDGLISIMEEKGGKLVLIDKIK